LSGTKTAGVVSSITNKGFMPFTHTGKSVLRTLLPYIAAIAAVSAGASYIGSRGSAGNRNELKALRKTYRGQSAEPFVELRPRIRQQARELDPSPIEE